MELVSEAIAFAVKAHDGMRRKKSESPYILHPMEVASIVGSMTTDEEIIAGAALHDVVEDTNITFADLAKTFPQDVLDILRLLTHDEHVDYFDYIRQIKTNPIAVKVKLADIEHNSNEARCTGSDLPPEKLLYWKEKYTKARAILMHE